MATRMDGRVSPLPRRSHDRSDSPTPSERPRSSSDATPRPAPRPLGVAAAQEASPSPIRRGGTTDPLTKPLAAAASRVLHHTAQHLPPRMASTPTPSSSPSPAGLAMGRPPLVSPQKPATRTYDAKLVSREMTRLGNLAHPSHGAALAATASSSTLSLPSVVAAPIIANPSADNPWGQLHVHVLPLFNGEPLRIPIEDLNQLVRRHLQAVVSRAPSRAISSLESDANELIAAGMMTLNAKLSGLEDEKLLSRVVEVWGFFWDQVLPYVEGVFLPLQTDNILRSLSRTPKAPRPGSPGPESSPMTSHQTGMQIDIRKLALRSFRDAIILPIFNRLHARLTSARKDNFPENGTYHQPRLQQMLLVLVSTAHHSLSLTHAPPPPTPGEQAVTSLLRAVRNPHTALQPTPFGPSRLPSFLSGGAPRDRRGRIARKSMHMVLQGLDGDNEETPRNGMNAFDVEREKDREFLDSLRSPDPEGGASGGGWGLGVGRDETPASEEEEDGMDNWDEAQDVVERMVGLKPAEAAPAAIDRRW